MFTIELTVRLGHLHCTIPPPPYFRMRVWTFQVTVFPKSPRWGYLNHWRSKWHKFSKTSDYKLVFEKWRNICKNAFTCNHYITWLASGVRFRHHGNVFIELLCRSMEHWWFENWHIHSIKMNAKFYPVLKFTGLHLWILKSKLTWVYENR
jgi:hypothetical protein